MQDLPDSIEPAPRPGSINYYCLVFTPRPHRAFGQALYALCRELDSARDASDPGIARLKLQWWREELLRSAAGEARHPITRQLGTATTVGLGALDAAVEQRERELAHDALGSETEFDAWAVRGTGSVLTLWARRLGGAAESEWQASLQALVRALHRLDTLRRTAPAARRGIALHPTQRLAEFAVDLAMLGAAQPPASVQALIARQRQIARDELELALRQWPTAQRQAHLPLLVLGDLRHATLLEQDRHGTVRSDQRVTLTPLRKLWRGWQRVRRERD